jgi:hypothetical protein
MTAGTTPKQADLWRGTAAVCEGRVGEQSIWAVLYHQGDRLVPMSCLLTCSPRSAGAACHHGSWPR